MIYDISPEISPKLNVWKDDVSFSRTVLCDIKNGDNLTLSSINTTLHLGAHTDAPKHYHAGGNDIATQNLSYYIGECQVIHVTVNRGERIKISHLKDKRIIAKRILFKTDSFSPYNWNNDFCAFSAELINFLSEKNVLLVGLDTPSVDLFFDKQLEAHSEIYKKNMVILEGVVLDGVAEGKYELIALPLKIKDADASPVRAILRDY